MYEDILSEFAPENCDLSFKLKRHGWFEKMTLADAGWTIRNFMELTIVGITEKRNTGETLHHKKMTEVLWKKLSPEHGKKLHIMCLELNKPDEENFQKTNQSKKKKN